MSDASLANITLWYERGVEQKATHMLILLDEFSGDNYPLFVRPDQDVRIVEKHFSDKKMSRVEEVYILQGSKEDQLQPGVYVHNH